MDDPNWPNIVEDVYRTLKAAKPDEGVASLIQIAILLYRHYDAVPSKKTFFNIIDRAWDVIEEGPSGGTPS